MAGNDLADQLAHAKKDAESQRNQNEILTRRIIRMELEHKAWYKVHLEYRFQIAQLTKLLGIIVQEKRQHTKRGLNAEPD